MIAEGKCGIAYAARYCALLEREVEVMLVRQPNGAWVPVRCTEKQQRCEGQTCPIKMHDGKWLHNLSWY